MTLRRTALLVAFLNLAWFGVEIGEALRIGSVSLLADSIDFLEDAAINLLIVLALALGAVRRARVGTALAGILLVPTLATLWAAWAKLSATVPVPPEPVALGLTGLGALAVNLACAALLLRHRNGTGSLSKAAFLSARNDALANVGIILAGVVTARTLSIWPDLVVGLAIAALNADAAREVLEAARDARRAAP